MDLSTTPRRATEGVGGDLQKTRVAKSVFSIRSLVDVEEAEVPANERSPSESLDFRAALKFRALRTHASACRALRNQRTGEQSLTVNERGDSADTLN